MKKGVVLVVVLLVFLVILTACLGRTKTTGNALSLPASTPETPSPTADTKRADSTAFTILDKSYLRNAQGVPVVLRLVVTLPVERSCKAAYDNDLIGEEKKGRGTIQVLAPLQGRTDLRRWNVCCQQGSMKNAVQRTAEMDCTS